MVRRHPRMVRRLLRSMVRHRYPMGLRLLRPMVRRRHPMGLQATERLHRPTLRKMTSNCSVAVRPRRPPMPRPPRPPILRQLRPRRHAAAVARSATPT